MPDVYVGVGSNIEPESNIAAAVEALSDEFGAIDSSSVYRNPPIGFDGSDFLNLVLRFQSSATPLAVDEVLGDLEQRAGRDRTKGQPGSRSLDLDLLLFGSMVDAPLRLPHEDIRRYSFVACPLAELAPRLRHPIMGTSIEELWTSMARSNPSLTNIGPVAESDASDPPPIPAAENR